MTAAADAESSKVYLKKGLQQLTFNCKFINYGVYQANWAIAAIEQTGKGVANGKSRGIGKADRGEQGEIVFDAGRVKRWGGRDQVFQTIKFLCLLELCGCFGGVFAEGVRVNRDQEYFCRKKFELFPSVYYFRRKYYFFRVWSVTKTPTSYRVFQALRWGILTPSKRLGKRVNS